MRDRLAAFLYWAAYWLERAADRVWYGNVREFEWRHLMGMTEDQRTAPASKIPEAKHGWRRPR